MAHGGGHLVLKGDVREPISHVSRDVSQKHAKIKKNCADRLQNSQPIVYLAATSAPHVARSMWRAGDEQQ